MKIRPPLIIVQEHAGYFWINKRNGWKHLHLQGKLNNHLSATFLTNFQQTSSMTFYNVRKQLFFQLLCILIIIKSESMTLPRSYNMYGGKLANPFPMLLSEGSFLAIRYKNDSHCLPLNKATFHEEINQNTLTNELQYSSFN